MKQIIINIGNCLECPHIRYKGTVNIDKEAKPKCDLAKRIIPHKSFWESGLYHSNIPKEIPKWCLLPDKKLYSTKDYDREIIPDID